jgi:hypothetical protein
LLVTATLHVPAAMPVTVNDAGAFAVTAALAGETLATAVDARPFASAQSATTAEYDVDAASSAWTFVLAPAATFAVIGVSAGRHAL